MEGGTTTGAAEGGGADATFSTPVPGAMPTMPAGYTALPNVPPTPPQGMLPPGIPINLDPWAFTESCFLKPLSAAPMGYVLGGLFGVFLASWEGISPPVLLPGVPMPPSKPMRDEFRATGRLMRRKAMTWGKNFALVTALLNGCECGLAKVRAKHDLVNPGIAGCVTGAALAAGQGGRPTLSGMAMGCAGFATFSVAIEHLMGRH